MGCLMQGIWECNICVAPSFWAPRKTGEEMGKLIIEDLSPEVIAERAADEAAIAETEALKEAARQTALGKKPMSEETKAALKELAESRKAMKQSIKEQFDIEGHPEVRLVKGKSKMPVFQDLLKQAEICAKFPWVIAGTFTQDPEKSGGTLLAIKCGTCGDDKRIIHLADAFHTKLCKACKKNGGKSKLDKQSTSGPDSVPGPAVDIK